MIAHCKVYISIPGTRCLDFVLPVNNTHGEVYYLVPGIERDVNISMVQNTFISHGIHPKVVQDVPSWGNPDQPWIQLECQMHNSWNWWLPVGWSEEQTRYLIDLLESGKIIMIVQKLYFLNHETPETVDPTGQF